MPDLEPQLDLAKVAFPTDRLSIKDLRKLFPAEFDAPGNARVQYFRAQGPRRLLGYMLDLERDIARATFEIAMGRPVPTWENESIRDLKNDLSASLIEHGLATGPHLAEQQIRDIEAQVISQAKAFSPPKRT